MHKVGKKILAALCGLNVGTTVYTIASHGEPASMGGSTFAAVFIWMLWSDL